MIVVNVADKKALSRITEWYGEVVNNSEPGTVCVVCGANTHLPYERAFTKEEVQLAAKSFGLEYVEIDDKAPDERIQRLFDTLASQVLSINKTNENT